MIPNAKVIRAITKPGAAILLPCGCNQNCACTPPRVPTCEPDTTTTGFTLPAQNLGEMKRALLSEMLVSSIACGDAGLEGFLAQNVATVWRMAPSACGSRERYLSAELSLIELAQGFTRNQIDIAKSRIDSSGGARFKSSNRRDSEGERHSQGSSVSWAKAQSFQHFKRDSEAHDRAGSDSESHTRANAFELMQDRSKQVGKSWAETLSKGHHFVDGSGDGVSYARQSTTSRSETKSAPLGTDTPPNPMPPDLTAVLSGVSLSWDIFDAWNNPLNAQPGWYTSGLRASEACQDSALDPDTDPPACEPYPTQGRGWSRSSHLNFNVSIPVIGGTVGASLSGSAGEQWRQTHVCTSGRTTISGENCSRQSFGQLNTERDWSASEGDARTMSLRSVHRVGESHRKSTSALDAFTKAAMDSAGESHTGSDSRSHAEGQATGQSQARSEDHSESAGQDFSDMTGHGESYRWSQIFDSLNEMWRRVFAELKDLKKIEAASVQVRGGRTLNAKAVCLPNAYELNERLRIRNQPCSPFRCG